MWVWERPREGAEFIGRLMAIVLLVACATNTLLVWASHDDDLFTWIISIAAAISAAGIITRVVWRVSVISEYAVWLACGMWVANFVEIVTSDVSQSGKFRNGGFYLAFALLSVGVYYVERVMRKVVADGGIDGGLDGLA